MTVTELPADLFLSRARKNNTEYFCGWRVHLFVPARNKRSQNESNIWSIFAGVHATGHGEERQRLSKGKGSRICGRKTGRNVDTVCDPAEARKREKDVRRLWICNAEARRQGSNGRGPAGPFPNYCQHIGRKQIWNLRLPEWPGAETKQRSNPASVPANAEKWRRASEGQGVLEGVRQLSRDWWGRERLRSRRLRRRMRSSPVSRIKFLIVREARRSAAGP